MCIRVVKAYNTAEAENEIDRNRIAYEMRL